MTLQGALPGHVAALLADAQVAPAPPPLRYAHMQDTVSVPHTRVSHGACTAQDHG